MANLYELDKLIEEFEFEIDEETGEITNMQDLDSLQLARDTKVENIALWVKNLKADAEAYKREKDSFAQKERFAKNKADRLVAYLQEALAGEKFKTDRVTISYRKSESVEVDDPSILPQMFFKEQEPKIDKAGIKESIKAGTLVAGAHLVEKQNLQIK